MKQSTIRTLDVRKTLVEFLNATASLHENRPLTPMPGSKMASDIASFGNELPFANAITIADLAFQYSHDHLSLFSRTLTADPDPFTCCTLIRSMLEPAAVAAWVVDPTIDVHTRVARMYSIRYESIVENVNVVRCMRGTSTADIDKTIARIDSLANDAIANGFSVGRRNGKICWVG